MFPFHCVKNGRCVYAPLSSHGKQVMARVQYCPDKVHADVPEQDNGPQRPGTKDAERTGSIPHCFEFNIMQALEGRIPGLCTGQ